jgi:hypothetical protein
MRLLLLSLILVVTCPAALARMYQWDDPDTGTPQLSGKPPYWYRGDESGPRVYVIDNGHVIDDTAVQVSDAQRRQLREAAFMRAEQDETRFRAKLEEAERLKAQRDAGREEALAAEQAAAPPVKEAPPATPEAAPQPDGDTKANSMRALVEEWEKIREETAKKVIHE